MGTEFITSLARELYIEFRPLHHTYALCQSWRVVLPPPDGNTVWNSISSSLWCAHDEKLWSGVHRKDEFPSDYILLENFLPSTTKCLWQLVAANYMLLHSMNNSFPVTFQLGTNPPKQQQQKPRAGPLNSITTISSPLLDPNHRLCKSALGALPLLYTKLLLTSVRKNICKSDFLK